MAADSQSLKIDTVKKGTKLSRAFHAAGNKTLEILARKPGRSTALVTMPGDGLMLLSGLALNNWGRVAAGAAGLVANTPLIFFGDRQKQTVKEHLDDQDQPFSHRILNAWKFWRYPWEFQAALNLGQMAAMTVLAGPDTASQAGAALQQAALVSQDAFRPGELACGVIGTAGFFVMFVQDQSTDATARGIRSIKTEFNAFAGFVKKRCADMVTTRNPLRNISTAFHHAVHDIAVAGPNTVAAKIFQVALVPYLAESVLIQDWKTAGSCVVYAGANWLLSRTSKRQMTHQAPETVAGMPRPAP